MGLEFQYEGTVYQLKSHVAWSRAEANSGYFLGLERSIDNLNSERSKLRRLIRLLKAKKVPVTHQTPAWWDDFRIWITRSQK